MAEMTLLDRLSSQFPGAKRGTLRRMLQQGRVRVNGDVARDARLSVASEDRVEVRDRGPSVEQRDRREALSDRITYEDDDLLVVNKPPGLLTSTGPRERRATLLAEVRRYLAARDRRARPGLIHRLDRDASGLLVFSKNDQAYRSLKGQFLDHSVRREYRAIVHGVPDPPSGRIETRLVERADGTVHSTRQHGRGVLAITDYQTLAGLKKLSLLRVVLHTGRKHQIRVHLRERGTPVVGDKVYGSEDGAARLMLAAIRLTLIHPASGNEITFTAALPGEFPIREPEPGQRGQA